jgi:hypothetical protein
MPGTEEHCCRTASISSFLHCQASLTSLITHVQGVTRGKDRLLFGPWKGTFTFTFRGSSRSWPVTPCHTRCTIVYEPAWARSDGPTVSDWQILMTLVRLGIREKRPSTKHSHEVTPPLPPFLGFFVHPHKSIWTARMQIRRGHVRKRERRGRRRERGVGGCTTSELQQARDTWVKHAVIGVSQSLED